MINTTIHPLLCPHPNGMPIAPMAYLQKEDGTTLLVQLHAVGEPNDPNFRSEWRPLPIIKESDLKQPESNTSDQNISNVINNVADVINEAVNTVADSVIEVAQTI